MQRLLLVDDDDSMREAIKDRLSHSYEVVDTGVAESALALTLEYRPDAILLDLTMPGLSGFELCRALSSLTFTQQIPIFVISGEDERNRNYCENLGASGFFTKPIDFEKLEAQLERVVQPKKAERRADVRVPLVVVLQLKGQSRGGRYFDVRVATENVSKGGFLCTSTCLLEDATTVAVSLCGERELDLGFAQLVRIVRNDKRNPRYGFQFIGASGTKIVE